MTEPVSVSLYLLNFDAEPVPDLARMIGWTKAADEAGIDRVILSDHVVLGERLENYARPELGGIRGGQQPTGPDGSWLDPLATIAYLSAVTISRAVRDPHSAGGAAQSCPAGQDRGDHRRAVRRAAGARRRRRLAARGI